MRSKASLFAILMMSAAVFIASRSLLVPTPATPATSTPATPATSIQETPEASTPATPATSIQETPEASQARYFSTVEAYFTFYNRNPISYRFGEPLHRRYVPGRVRQQVLERDLGCVICGHNGEPEVDHRIALGNGGDNSIENLSTLCHEHHVEKTRLDKSVMRKRKKLLKQQGLSR